MSISLLAAKPVKNVAPQRVTFRQIRMAEITALAMRHSNFLHHAPGSGIGWNGGRHNLVEAQLFEHMSSFLRDHRICRAQHAAKEQT